MSSASAFPLPLAWTARLAELEWVIHAPIVSGAHLLVRVARNVFRIRMADGVVEGVTEVDPAETSGLFALGHGDLLVTDGRSPARTSTVSAVTGAGAIAWTATLDVRLAKQTGTIADDQLLLCGEKPGSGNQLVTLDVSTGEIVSQVSLPYGASSCVPFGERRLVASPAPIPDNPGLYTVSKEGREPEALDPRPVQRLSRDGQRAIVCMRPMDEGSFELGVYDLVGHSLAWARPVAGPACAINGDDVACLQEGDGDAAMPALHDAASGDVRWRATVCPAAPPSKAALVGPIAMFSYGHGVALYARSDGRHLGEALGFGEAAIAARGHLYIGGSEQLACASIEGLVNF